MGITEENVSALALKIILTLIASFNNLAILLLSFLTLSASKSCFLTNISNNISLMIRSIEFPPNVASKPTLMTSNCGAYLGGVT